MTTMNEDGKMDKAREMDKTGGMEFTRDVMEALAAPFADDEIEFLPRATSGAKAMALAYIDARDVMRRLDAVVGPSNWQFDFDFLPTPTGGTSGKHSGVMVKGRLTVLGVTKCDAGEAGAEEEALKSAVSDALKRCAVHFGIGRYLYYLPRVWAQYDAARRQFVERPRLASAGVERALALCGVSSSVSRPENGRVRLNGAGSGGGVRAGGGPDSRPAEPERSGRPGASVMEPPAARHAPLGLENGTSEESVPLAPGAPGFAEREPGEEETGSRGAPAGRPRSIWSAGTVAPESSGDRAATRGAGTRQETTDAAPREAPRGQVCSQPECEKLLTRGQQEMSMRMFGRHLCPSCQKQAR
jgi:hypothetical protein